MSFLQLPARRVALVLTIALVAVGIAVPAAQAARTEKVTTTTYLVTGSTENEIRASLNAKRPGEYDARTTWHVSWSYASAMRSGRCRVASSKVHTKIAFTYPRWVAPADATSKLKAKWSTYMAKLRVHEAGHARIGRVVAARVHATLARANAKDCRALDRALPALVKPHYTWGNAADRSYDRRTKHGETQGAVFP
jgi:predicted secreted Zn-dependent protease